MAIHVATRDVAPDGPRAGSNSTTSKPITRPRRATSTKIARSSRWLSPPGSCSECPGAIEESSTSRSIETYSASVSGTVSRTTSPASRGHVEASRRAPPELSHPVHLDALDIANPERGDRAHERQLRQPPQLARARETRAIRFVHEIGVRVDVHDIQLAERLHPAGWTESPSRTTRLARARSVRLSR